MSPDSPGRDDLAAWEGAAMPGTRTETIPLVDDSELEVTVSEPAGAVRGGIVVLHAARGVTERTTRITEGLAEEGWLALAPHLHHREGGAPDTDDPVESAQGVSGESVLADSDVCFGYLAEHGVSSDLMGVLGFDLGATAALVVASQRSLGAAVTVAAAGVEKPLADGLPALLDVVGELTCPWLGLYGEHGDAVDPVDVDRLREAAHASDRVVDVVVYPDGEHRFDTAESRGGASGDDPLEPAGEASMVQARSRVLNWFDAHLR